MKGQLMLSLHVKNPAAEELFRYGAVVAQKLVTANSSGQITCFQWKQDQIISGTTTGSLELRQINWRSTWEQELPLSECLKVFEGHEGSVLCCQWQGNQLISGGFDGRVLIWDLYLGTLKQQLTDHAGAVNCLEWIDNNLITGSQDMTVKVWSLDTFTCVHTLCGHTAGVRCLQWVGLPVLITGSWDATIRLWNLTTRECVQVLQTSSVVRDLHLSGPNLVAGGNDGCLSFWKLQGSSAEFVRRWKAHSLWVNCVLLQGHTIVSGSQDGTIKVWDLDSGDSTRPLLTPSSLVQESSLVSGVKVTCCHWESNFLVAGLSDTRICIIEFGDSCTAAASNKKAEPTGTAKRLPETATSHTCFLSTAEQETLPLSTNSSSGNVAVQADSSKCLHQDSQGLHSATSTDSHKRQRLL